MLNIKMARSPKQLGLSGRGTWGGWRAGAGRPRGRGSHYVPHVQRPSLSRHHAMHVTLRVRPEAPRLRMAHTVGVVGGALRAERSRKGFRLIHYSIRQDHLHLICEAEDRRALGCGVQRIASRVARGVNRIEGRSGKVFADRYHGRIIRTPRDARHVLAYVLLNEHKDWARSGVRVIGVDPHSSGMVFDGWADVRPRPPPERKWVCVRPRSWLLSRGWRKWGLIRTDERAPR